MVLIKQQAKQSTLTNNLNQKIMSYQVFNKEATRNKYKACQDEIIVASFLEELPKVLASLESLSEKNDSRK